MGFKKEGARETTIIVKTGIMVSVLGDV